MISRICSCLKACLSSVFSRSLPASTRPPHTDQHNLSLDNSTQCVPPDPAQEPIGSHTNYGSFSGSHGWSMKAEGDIIFNDHTRDNFMRDLLQYAAVEAMSDSCHRYPPPRCAPGTRRTIIERCKTLLSQPKRQRMIAWIVGPARVGKTAVMQNVSEEIPEHITSASLFFSAIRSLEGNRIIPTIAYQLAVQCEPYRHFIRTIISHDPSIFTKSLPAQFRKFIIEPFIQPKLINNSHQFLILIDALELSGHLLTQDLLRLILDFRINFPTSPVVWIISSRPEPYITSFFENVEATTALVKEESTTDSCKARGDIKLFLFQ